MKIDNRVLDTGAVGFKEEIQNGVDVLLEGAGGLVLVVCIQKDDSFATALGNILILPLLRVGKIVILIKYRACVDGIGLPVPALDDSDTSASDVPESQMETSEFGPDNQEHPKQRLGVLHRRQKLGVQSEAQCDLCGRVEIGFPMTIGILINLNKTEKQPWREEYLQHVLVKGNEVLHNFLLVFIPNSPGNLRLQLVIVQNPIHLQAQITQSWDKVILFSTSLHVMRVGK